MKSISLFSRADLVRETVTPRVTTLPDINSCKLPFFLGSSMRKVRESKEGWEMGGGVEKGGYH